MHSMWPQQCTHHLHTGNLRCVLAVWLFQVFRSDFSILFVGVNCVKKLWNKFIIHIFSRNTWFHYRSSLYDKWLSFLWTSWFIKKIKKQCMTTLNPHPWLLNIIFAASGSASLREHRNINNWASVTRRNNHNSDPRGDHNGWQCSPAHKS